MDLVNELAVLEDRIFRVPKFYDDFEWMTSGIRSDVLPHDMVLNFTPQTIWISTANRGNKSKHGYFLFGVSEGVFDLVVRPSELCTYGVIELHRMTLDYWNCDVVNDALSRVRQEPYSSSIPSFYILGRGL